MNRTFSPVLSGAQIQGTGMKHPRVPKVIIGSELNGFVQGDLMDANAISQYITEKIGSSSGASYDELYRKITSLQEEDEEHSEGIRTIETKLLEIEQIIQNNTGEGPSVNENADGDLIVVF